MKYSIRTILEITGGQVLNGVLFDSPVERLLFDSRHLVFPAQTLFFAFKSNRQNGHSFIKELYEQGVKNFIVTELIDFKQYPKANFILVKNSIAALQKIAKFHRQQFSFPIIGITGSNGKTIIKEWLFQLLSHHFKITRNPGSYNSQIGVPLSVWQLKATDELGIFEAGISQVGEMEKIAPIIDSTLGIFTNIGEAHQEGFTSKAEKIKEKLKLFEHTKKIIYCRDNEQVDELMQANFLPSKLWAWSFHKEAALKISTVVKNEANTTIKAIYQNQKLSFTIPFTDAASIENAIHCCATMLYLKLGVANIQKYMPLLEPVSMRLELKEGINNCTLINDSYNADLTSLELALNFATKRAGHKKLVLFLSDILQSGLPANLLYEKVAQLILAKNIHRLVAIGNDVKVIKQFLPKKFLVAFHTTTSDFLRQFKPTDFQKNTILFKGARIFQFEKIVHRFAEKVHKTVLEVNLSALVHNLKVYSQYLQPETKLMAMVKASAYGSGSVEVAKILEFYKVDYLTVAYTDEGVELRKAGIQLPIMVLNPEAASFDALVRYQLEPEIYSLDLLQQLIAFLPVGQALLIHLKLDTGMHRLGFEKENLKALIKLLYKNPAIKIKTIFSHLAASDMEIHDRFTQIQVSRFLEMYEQICQNISYRPIRHILNSSGILRFSQYQFEMVRLGIGLYGIDGSSTVQSQLKVVNTLKASISQIKTLGSQETVGYSRNGKIDQHKRIATINIGYADGLARKTGNGNYAFTVQGKKAPIIGNVCMDMCMIDITHIPTAKVGDEVIVFGNTPTVKELANCLETIPYEIFTSISKRVKRIYFRD